MDYKKGDRVKHPTKKDWGLGEVLEDNVGNVLRVFFAGVGEKRLSLKYVQPTKVQGKEASDEVLDSLSRRGTEVVEEEIRAANREASSRRDFVATEELGEDIAEFDWEEADPDAYDDDDDESYDDDDFDGDDI